jgi:RNA polymerase sigma-70 factor, ECF subfamily
LMTAAKRNLLQAYRHSKLQADPAVSILLVDEDTPAANAPELPDERLKLLFACAHPAIDPSVRTALMLQTVLGLEAEKIATAFLVSSSAMAQRLVRAKTKIRLAGIQFEEPEARELPERVHNVLEAIYAAYGLAWDDQVGHDFAEEAIYLADLVAALLPAHAEPAGLLALMLFCESRKAARTTASGYFVPLYEQDVGRWDKLRIDQANQILWHASRLRAPGPFQLEAAIQSAHCQRLYTGNVPWQSIVQLYAQLVEIAPTLGAAVGHGVAQGEAHGAAAGLQCLDDIEKTEPARVESYQPFWVARAYLLAKSGDATGARTTYVRALGLTHAAPTRIFLQTRIDAL